MVWARDVGINCRPYTKLLRTLSPIHAACRDSYDKCDVSAGWLGFRSFILEGAKEAKLCTGQVQAAVLQLHRWKPPMASDPGRAAAPGEQAEGIMLTHLA